VDQILFSYVEHYKTSLSHIIQGVGVVRALMWPIRNPYHPTWATDFLHIKVRICTEPEGEWDGWNVYHTEEQTNAFKTLVRISFCRRQLAG
jgi:hypothetical protein